MKHSLPDWALPGSHIHLVGIKGVAMTALAQILLDVGCNVSGSDVAEEFVTQPLLQRLGVQLLSDFSETHVSPNVRAVVFTGAHQGRKNPEVQRAIALGIPVMNHADAFAQMIRGQSVYAICGVGGKSTVSAMVAFAATQLGWQPGYSVGVGSIPGLDRTGRLASPATPGKMFIAEADEYACEPGLDQRSRFEFLDPQVIVCTNIAYDHPDVFSSLQETMDRYVGFFSKLQNASNGLLVVNADDANTTALLRTTLLPTVAKLSFGESAHADLQLVSIRTDNHRTLAHLKWKHQDYELELAVPGMHNVKNAMAAILCLLHAGATMEQASGALRTFLGTMRRFQALGEKQGAVWYDDYAHHPNEIRATLSALHAWEPGRRLIIVFQPHTYSRTKALLRDFGTAFELADQVVIPNIFASAREPFDPTVTSQTVAAEILQSGVSAVASGDLRQTADVLQEMLKPGDVVMTMGAGDVYKIFSMV